MSNLPRHKTVSDLSTQDGSDGQVNASEGNIDMIVQPTNSGIYTLKDTAMYAIRNVDARLQEVQATIAKSSYVTMKLAEEMMQAHTEGHLPQRLYDGFSDHCLHMVTFNSFMLQQLEQVRRTAFKHVLPPHLRGLTKLPTGKHEEIFGMIYLPGRRSGKLKQN